MSSYAKRFLLLTLGSRGDVEPFIALGSTLLKAGQEVILCTSERFRSMATAHGLTFAPMTDGFIDMIESRDGRASLEGSASPVQRLRTLQRLAARAEPLQVQVLRDGWAAAEQHRPDRIVHHVKITGAADIAHAFGVPHALALLTPMVAPTSAWASPVFPAWLQAPMWRGLRRPGYGLVNLLATRLGSGPVHRWRGERGLGRRPQSIDLRHDAQGRAVPLLHAHSEHLLPRPADWPAQARASGFWRLPTATGWEPTPELAAFLQSGPPPVYVGFGSMVGRDPEALALRVVEALDRAGARGLLARGWGGLTASALPPEVMLLDEAPHDALFPHMAAVVHHGGAGTTAAGLYAGRPTVVCPFFGDQPFWGRLVHQRGLGPEPLPIRQLTPAALATRIREAVDSPPVRAAAEDMGRKLRAEDGLGRAARWLVQDWR
jgi:sterol 3beta-glucosyltransferase